MTPDQFGQLDAVNVAVNAIPYTELSPQEPPDIYRDEPVPSDGWVCRDYVMRKGTLLRPPQGTWPPEDLTEIVCYVETGERHAILRVMVDGEPWILDSRFPDITPMYPPRGGYRYEAEQIAGTTEFQPIA